MHFLFCAMILLFSAGFLYTFSIKTFLTKYIPNQLTSFNVRPNFLIKMKTKCIFKYSFRQLMML